MRCHIPSRDVFGPILRRYLEEYQGLVGAESTAWDNAPSKVQRFDGVWKPEGTMKFANAIGVLAEETGLERSTIEKHANGKRQWIHIDVADKLLCKMGWVHLWHEEPLRDHYFSVEFPESRMRYSKCGHIRAAVVPMYDSCGKCRAKEGVAA